MPRSVRTRKIRNQRLVEKRYLLACRRLEYLDPFEECIAVYGRILSASALQPLEKDIHRSSHIVQFHCSAKRSRPEPQSIALRPRPCAPFDDHGEALRQQLLSKLPLQRLHLRTHVFPMEIDR